MLNKIANMIAEIGITLWQVMIIYMILILLYEAVWKRSRFIDKKLLRPVPVLFFTGLYSMGFWAIIQHFIRI